MKEGKMLRMVQMRLQAISRIAPRAYARTGLVRWLSLKNKGLPAPTDHAQRFIELSPSRKVSIMDAGSGQNGTVIAIHGCPGSVYDFRYLGAVLERAGVRVIRVDMPGNTRTPLEATAGVGDAADGHVLGELVRELADALRVEQPLLLAHSVGSQVALNAADAATDGRFLGLALLSPAPLLVPHKMIRPYWLVKAVCRLSTKIDSLSEKLVVLWGFDARISGEEAVFIMKRLVYVDWWCQEARATRLRARRVPTLMAYTHDDPMIEGELFHQLSQVLPSGPRLVFPNGGHFPNKWHAEEIGGALLEFMSLAKMNRLDDSREQS